MILLRYSSNIRVLALSTRGLPRSSFLRNTAGIHRCFSSSSSSSPSHSSFFLSNQNFVFPGLNKAAVPSTLKLSSSSLFHSFSSSGSDDSSSSSDSSSSDSETETDSDSDEYSDSDDSDEDSSLSPPLLPSSTTGLSEQDKIFLKQAVECARKGRGHTFPNPAVGCVLVRQDTNEIIGSGFHPRAGYPHAEVFALLEAAGHVPDGVAAAQAVVNMMKMNHSGSSSKVRKPMSKQQQEQLDHDEVQLEKINALTETYASKGGPEELFGNCFLATGTETEKPPPVTAYVTLEPCCHHGKTPPCASSLVVAKVQRVVVGFRDPNPRVDGGGVKVLREAGVVVDMAGADDDDGDDDENSNSDSGGDEELENECFALVEDFCKRITPRMDWSSNNYEAVTGKMRRALRTLANRKKAEGSLVSVSWGGASARSTAKGKEKEQKDDVAAATALDLPLQAEWMEHLDNVLWREELINLKLAQAVSKRKDAKQLGDRIAKELQAHVAQSVGHTILLYRPGVPPEIDLEELITADNSDTDSNE